jgi:toluene monooxygenase system protein A
VNKGKAGNSRQGLQRSEWLPLAKNLDWEFTYADETRMFPPEAAGGELTVKDCERWNEPFKTTYGEYVANQAGKDASVYAVRDSIGVLNNVSHLPPEWLNALKFHSAIFPLAEFAAVIGNLRAARFARNSAWRDAALFGALDECRHTQIPLLLMHELVRFSGQFDWTHKFYHSKNWVAIAARHMIDELLLMSDPIEFAIATNFVFETGFTNLQFIGLSALARSVGDHVFEKMVKSIQTDEARHAQIGPATLEILARKDPARAQYLLDKWFWRSWHLFSILTGFCMDYLTPLEHRKESFKEFMEEWVLDQYLSSLKKFGLKRPWYWETFLQSLETYHHMAYVSAYSYRATLWFDLPVPGPEERKWLRAKYPKSFPVFEKNWDQVGERWKAAGPGVDFAVHGTSIIGFCDLCQIVLCEGTPENNSARVVRRDGRKYIFCSQPCEWIFHQEFSRYGEHKDLVKKVLAGEAPGNLLAMLTQYFGLTYADWGKDLNRGNYAWLESEKDTSLERERERAAERGPGC